jgi:hypothetical protein
MKLGLKIFVSFLLAGAVACLFLAFSDHGRSAKWLSSSGLMFDIAGIAQLDIVGFFQKIIDRYSDEARLSTTRVDRYANRSIATCSTSTAPASI